MDTDSSITSLSGSALIEGGKGQGDSGWVNKGYELWEKRRKEWVSKGKAPNGNAAAGRSGAKGLKGGAAVAAAAAEADRSSKRARSVDVDTIIESIFSTAGDARLPQPVPLSQMIDLLVDFWEADGLYD